MLNGEAHVPRSRHLTTLAGYVHWQLTGRQVLGVGEASGMFPVDSATGTFDARMLALYDARIAPRRLPWRLEDILPTVLQAGDEAGTLTPAGALLLDPTGDAAAGHPPLPARGRRRDRHDRHQQRRAPHRQRLCGHVRVLHGGAGAAPVPGLSRD